MAGSSLRDEERQDIIRAKSTMLPKNRFADGEKTKFFILWQLKPDQPLKHLIQELSKPTGCRQLFLWEKSKEVLLKGRPLPATLQA